MVVQDLLFLEVVFKLVPDAEGLLNPFINSRVPRFEFVQCLEVGDLLLLLEQELVFARVVLGVRLRRKRDVNNTGVTYF